LNKDAERRAQAYLAQVRKQIEKHFAKPSWSKRTIGDRAYDQYCTGNLQWLESFCKGKGFNMGCGELSIADSIGVDRILSLASYNGIAFQDMNKMYNYPDGCADYIVSNYIEAIECPVVTFTDWYRLLKPGGTIALVCTNGAHEFYKKRRSGPLARGRRGSIKKFSCYTPLTMRYYLEFVKFGNVEIEEHGTVLRSKGVKRDG